VRLLRRLMWLLRARQHDEALREEMEDHRARIQADLEAEGLPADEAERASRRAMGNVAVLREDARDVWLVRWLDQVARDLRHGARGLRREPTFALTAILTLTIGMAATTTVFSVVDAELWRPMPYPEPDRIMVAFVRGPGRGSTEPMTEVEVEVWRQSVPAFETVATSGSTRRVTMRLDAAESVLAGQVSSDYFSVLTRPVLAGRAFQAGDRDRPQAAVLTDRLWARVFDRDPSVVGRTVILDDRAVAVIGVVDADQSTGPDVDLFVNLDATDVERDRDEPRFWNAVGRLAPGVEPEVALAQLEAAVADLNGADAERWDGRTVELETLLEYHTGFNHRPLYFFLGAALVVLVLTMVNVASLLVARAMRRIREFALRGALGGGRAALSRQLVVEGALLALPAGALALLLTTWAVALVSSALPPDVLARGSEIPVDLRSAVCAFGLTSLTAATFGLMPLVITRHVHPGRLLGSGSRTGAAAADGRVRVVLLTAQLALTVILLAGAGIFVKSFVALTSVPLGFDPTGAAAARIALPADRYGSDEQIRAYVSQLMAETAARPGVTMVAAGTSSPLGSGPMVNYLDPEVPKPGPGEEPRAIVRSVTPAFFDTLGIPIVRGRAFGPSDVRGAPRVAIVNEYVASQLSGKSDVTGRVVELMQWRGDTGVQDGPVTIVGVAHDVKEIGLNEVKFGGIYVPFAQAPVGTFELVARGTGSGADVVADLRAAAAATDPTLPVTRLTTYEQRVDDALRGDRFNLMLISMFAAVALLLAAIGVYGVVAYAVEARTRELGVRMALGARPLQLIGSAVAQSVRLAVAGGLVGLGVTALIARLAGDAFYLVPGSHNGILYQVSMTDPVMLAAAFVGIVVVALVAASVPARRAARIDPVQALRAD